MSDTIAFGGTSRRARIVAAVLIVGGLMCAVGRVVFDNEAPRGSAAVSASESPERRLLVPSATAALAVTEVESAVEPDAGRAFVAFRVVNVSPESVRLTQPALKAAGLDAIVYWFAETTQPPAGWAALTTNSSTATATLELAGTSVLAMSYRIESCSAVQAADVSISIRVYRGKTWTSNEISVSGPNREEMLGSVRQAICNDG